MDRTPTWFWLALLTLGACTQPDTDADTMCMPADVIDSGRVDFWLFDVEEADICLSSFDAAERHARWVSESWGSDVEAPIHYEIFGTSKRCWPCADTVEGCAVEGSLATTWIPHHHEIAHAAHGPNCSSFIEEGWASLYGSPFENVATAGTLEDVAAALESGGGLPAEYYGFAARFVAFVIDGWGMAAVHALCELSLGSGAEFDAGMQQVLGLSLEQAQLALNEVPEWGLGWLRRDEACEHEASLSAPFTSTIEVGCDSDGVEGVLGRSAWSRTVVDLGEGGSYAFTLETLEPVELWVEIRSCTREGLASSFYEVGVRHPRPMFPGEFLLVGMPAGRHVISIRDEDARANLEVGVLLQPWP